MFSSINWSAYFFYLILIIAVYYLVIWLVLFKGRLPRLKSLRLPQQHSDDYPDEVLHTTQHIIDELRPLFKGRTNKNELLLALQQQLQKYNAWDEPGFRDSLQQFIIHESQSICSIQFSEEDLRVLWL